MQFIPENISVQQIQYRDLDKMEKLFKEEFGKEVNMNIITGKLRKLRRFYYFLLLLRYFSSRIRDLWNVYIFKYEGEFVGFIQISNMGNKTLHLDYIAIVKKYRGQGLGRYILHNMFKKITDPQSYDFVLEVRLDNPAQDLYRAMGFQAKSKILHYERTFRSEEFSALRFYPALSLHLLRSEERNEAYKLYRESIPKNLRQIVGENRKAFFPGVIQLQFEKVKNRILKKQDKTYISKIGSQIVAAINIKSYEAAQYHMMTVYVQSAFEAIREKILRQALAELGKRYTKGTVGITIYDDYSAKQHGLEAVGFKKKETYFFMYRKAAQPSPVWHKMHSAGGMMKRSEKAFMLKKNGEKAKKK